MTGNPPSELSFSEVLERFKILTDTEEKIQEKVRALYFGYQTTSGSLFNKASHHSNCHNNYVWLNGLITFCFNFQLLIFINSLSSR